MKRTVILISFLSIVFLSSCKYDQTPAGTYTGTYSASSFPYFPVSSGNATLIVTQNNNTHCNITFTSPGNPNLVFNDVPLKRYASPGGASFLIHLGSYDSPLNVYANIYERDYLGNNWPVDFHYADSTYATFYFDGIREP